MLALSTESRCIQATSVEKLELVIAHDPLAVYSRDISHCVIWLWSHLRNSKWQYLHSAVIVLVTWSGQWRRRKIMQNQKHMFQHSIPTIAWLFFNDFSGILFNVSSKMELPSMIVLQRFLWHSLQRFLKDGTARSEYRALGNAVADNVLGAPCS